MSALFRIFTCALCLVYLVWLFCWRCRPRPQLFFVSLLFRDGRTNVVLYFLNGTHQMLRTMSCCPHPHHRQSPQEEWRHTCYVITLQVSLVHGYDRALIEHHRPNIFTQCVASHHTCINICYPLSFHPSSHPTLPNTTTSHHTGHHTVHHTIHHTVHHTTHHTPHTTHHTTHYMTSQHKAWHDTTQVLLNTSVYIVLHYIVVHLLHHAVCMSHWTCPLPLVVRSRPPQNHDDQQKEREQKMPKCLIQPQLRPILFTQNPKQDQKFQYPLRVLETFPCTNIHFHYAIISKLNQFFKDHLQKKRTLEGSYVRNA